MKRDQLFPTAARLADIEPFHVMEVQNRAQDLEAQGRHIIHMEIGQPDFAAPPQVIEAATQAMRERSLGYTPATRASPIVKAADFFNDFCRRQCGKVKD
jgi:aspartate/methionine/tyrosine aminotransferase